MTVEANEGACPVFGYRFQSSGDPAVSNFRKLDSLQKESRPFLRADEAQGYWVFTDHEVILEGLQHPELFSNRVIVPIEPDPPYKWIPIMLDPPEHTKWRKLLGLYFSPGRIERLKDEQRTFAVELIEKFRASGSCDFYQEFAQIFPTTIFLQILGLPIEKLPEFLEWETKILHVADDDPERKRAMEGMQQVGAYFHSVIAEKRANPELRGDDIVSNALDWQIDGEPAGDMDVLNCMLLLFMAGLDTVAAQLSYTLYHLATHPEDRRRIAEDPSRIPHAVEELVRAYPIVQTARKATSDFDFHGCPVKAGDMISFPLAMAGRDPKNFERGGEVDLDAGVVRHISFGAGPHRCLGSHLARQEMVVALEEWHRLIPEYDVADESRVVEHTGGVYSIDCLPLTWKN